MNCARRCLKNSYPGIWGGPLADYAFWLVPQHPICWWECHTDPVDICVGLVKAAGSFVK
jgi:hypothetical protein